MPLKITTTNRAKHEVAENISANDLLTGKTKRKGWVRVKPKPPSDGVAVYVKLRQIVEVRVEPDHNADPDPEPGIAPALKST